MKFELRGILRSEYRIDRFQETYFVIDGFQQLFAATEPDFTPVYERVRRLPPIAPDEATWDDVVVRAETAPRHSSRTARCSSRAAAPAGSEHLRPQDLVQLLAFIQPHLEHQVGDAPPVACASARSRVAFS